MQSGGSTFRELSKERIESFQVPKLSMEEQKRIAGMVKLVDEYCTLLLTKKSKFAQIKKALMNVLLTGERRVRIY
jgi:restriction endonuclease S subunit